MRQSRQMAELHVCTSCASPVEARLTSCPVCGRWLGRGPLGLWLGCVIVGGLLITIAFFFPWIEPIDTAQRQVLSGYELARLARQLANVAPAARPTAAASIALYLAPLAGLGMVLLLLVVRSLNLTWHLVGRLLVALAVLPGQISVLIGLFALGLLGEGRDSAWLHAGLIATALGSLLVIVAGVALGGPGLPLILRRGLPVPVGRSWPDRLV